MVLLHEAVSQNQIQEVQRLINEGFDELEKDFNYKNIMERYRKCEFETEQQELKNLVNYNEFYDNKVIKIHGVEDKLAD